MKSFKIDPAHEFSFELSHVKEEHIYELAIRALHKAPDYFWFVPSSSSGKYHPKNTLGIGGLVRHVKAVTRTAITLLENTVIANPSSKDFNHDEIIVACILHDCLKQGSSSEPTHTVHEHPLLVREHLRPDNLTVEQSEAWERICDLIDTHMGSWIIDKHKKSDVILPLPINPSQRFVHMCDYIGSRKDIEVDVSNREAQLGYNANKDEAWKSDPIQPGQSTYLSILYEKMIARGLGPLPTPSNKGEASEAITKMKAILGIK